MIAVRQAIMSRRMTRSSKRMVISKLHNVIRGLESLEKVLTENKQSNRSMTYFIELVSQLVREALELLGDKEK